jgi:hypothetical protein
MAQCLDHRVARFRDSGDFGDLLFGLPKLISYVVSACRQLPDQLFDKFPGGSRFASVVQSGLRKCQKR